MQVIYQPTANLDFEIAAKINFACHQNAVPVLRSLEIENPSDKSTLNDLTVSLEADPPFLQFKTWHIERIAPNGLITPRDRDLKLNGEYLFNLEEAIRGHISIRVNLDGEIIAEKTVPVELLARNEWGGAGYMPELLAAYVVPNDPAAERVLRKASQLLRKAGRNDALDGYQSGSRQRVWEIVSAIYSAIASLDLSYAVPPASFERDGQRIRLPSQIMERRLATCLDTTLLFAAAVEQAGLNPIIVMPKDHALIGVWLQPEEFSTIVVDEAETVRKRIPLKELVIVETTLASSFPPPPFSRAVKAAEDLLDPDLDSGFHCAVDVRRARMHRINPLPLVTPGAGSKDDEIEIEVGVEAPPPLPDFDIASADEPQEETPEGRLERWQRRLLDLTLNNRLLNHRATKTSLKLICPDPGLLEDKLANGARISIQPVPDQKNQDEEIHRQRTGEVITEEYAREALGRNQVLVDLPLDELSKRGVEIYRRTQTALQEGGSNTLYLALGFLLWKRDEKDDRRFRAPLILLPVSLERRSVRSGVRIKSHDDEARFNTTLLQMLRTDFEIDIRGFDNELPMDESGIDVALIWNRVRQAVLDAPGFEVVEDVVLGHFSFAKYLMWKDLVDRSDQLRENPVVRHLIDTPRDPYSGAGEFVHPRELDRKFKPSDLLAPLPADSSQLASLAAADAGKDFVIIGPPGTGKSQTISNLITHLLGKGKTVLFVSEKTAALEVVYRRLRQIGMDAFCLQLHSNKASKADVLNQLRSAWDHAEEETEEEWSRQALELEGYRDRLNLVVDRLHHKHPNGLTPHYAIGIKIRDQDLARVSFNWPRADQHDEKSLLAMRRVVEKLAIQSRQVGDVFSSPFKLVSKSDWSPQWESQISERAGDLSASAKKLEESYSQLCDRLGLELPDLSLKRLEALSGLAKALADSYRKNLAFTLEPLGVDQIEAFDQASIRLQSFVETKERLSCPYEDDAWRRIDGQQVKARWGMAQDSWWPKSFFLRRSLIKEMQTNGATGKPDPEVDAELLVGLREEGTAIDDLGEIVGKHPVWRAQATNAADITELREIAKRLRKHSGALFDDPQALMTARSSLRQILSDGNDLLGPGETIGRAIEDFQTMLSQYRGELTNFEVAAGGKVAEHFSDARNALDAVREMTDDIISHRSELAKWCAWRRARQEAVERDLLPLVNAIEAGTVNPEETKSVFEASYCTWWSTMIMGADDILRQFSVAEHEALIQKFCDLDDEFCETTAAYVNAKLRSALPSQRDVNRVSEWGVLQRELQKKRKHKAVRQLVAELPTALMQLTPCFMMSPLSIAQYLPTGQSLFDVVIFDEASQITVWDAVGAIARGRQVIVAGDPKQMPPTNFFQRSDDDPDGDVDFDGDLESILDEMLGAGIPHHKLNWHYRSRVESLIAFSNHRYYDNTLITFPAPSVRDEGVKLIKVDGYYARGGARTNEAEARAIVQECVRRLTSPDPKLREQTIGIVTFNSEQQTLIENLLDEERARHRDIEKFFSSDGVSEPVFVKNLETVQGDERDIILFSVTYGPDISGHVTMNFGPLNREGGERRLNVALTRSRSEMRIFATIRPEQIDLSRTQATAVRDLKHYLEFADRGAVALGEAIYGSQGDFESPFEAAVAVALREKGWDVHPQIGVSAYRIDLGVVHPDEPASYLAGIECDGATYHSSATARDRDKIRQNVLENLGWTLVRIWSTDWWINREGALREVDEDLKQILEEDRERRARVEEENAQNGEEAELATAGTTDEDDGIWEEELPLMEGEKEEDPETLVAGGDPASDDDEIGPAPKGKISVRRYRQSRLREFPADPGAFYDRGYRRDLVQMIAHVVEVEGPVHEDILLRRIARHHGFRRAGKRIRDIVLDIAKRRHGKTSEDCGTFFWPSGTVKDRTVSARIEGRDNDLRNVRHICSEEIRAISDALGKHRDPVLIARAIGLSRLEQSSRDRLAAALNEG